MRKLLSWVLNLAAGAAFLYGCNFYVTAWDFYQGSVEYLTWAQYQIACSSPDESSDCARLYADEPVWENDVVITDQDTLFTMAAFFLDTGATFLTLGSFFIGMAGVILAASIIVHGQAKTRQEVHDALDTRESQSDSRVG